MADTSIRNDRWLGILACCAIVWNALGIAIFFVAVVTSREALLAGGSTVEQVDYIFATPLWAKAANAIAVFAGLAGSIALLMRQKPAYVLFAISLIGIMGTMLDAALRDGYQLMGGVNYGMPLVAIVIGIFLFWLTYSAARKGHLH